MRSCALLLLLLCVLAVDDCKSAEPQCKSCSLNGQRVQQSSHLTVRPHPTGLAHTLPPDNRNKRATHSQRDTESGQLTVSKHRPKRTTEFPSRWERMRALQTRLRGALVENTKRARLQEDIAASFGRWGHQEPYALHYAPLPNQDGRWEDGPVDLNEPTRSQNKWNELLEKLQGEWGEVVEQGNIKNRKHHHKAAGEFFPPPLSQYNMEAPAEYP